jgi:hypothetical protein
MPAMDAISSLRVIRGPGGMPVAFPFMFTTDGSAAVTIQDTYGGLFNCVMSSAGTVFTLTFPAWYRTLSFIYVSEQTATINISRTITPSTGTIVLTASAALNSAEVAGVLWCSTSMVD